METNRPFKLERTLSLTSEPKTLTKEQCDYARAVASMQAFEKQCVAGNNARAQSTGGAKGKADRDEGTSGAAARKLPA